MTSHTDDERLTELGFRYEFTEELPQFGCRGSLYAMPGALLKELWVLETGRIVALRRWCEDMTVDEFIEWWRKDLERKARPKEKQRGLFDNG